MANNSSSDSWKILIIIIIAIIVFWFVGGIVTYYIFDSWSDRGTFGDMFGSINALFAGLAFAGLIYTINLQRNELRLQREELELTRIELSRTATAQEESEHHLADQVAALKDSVKAQTIIFLFDYLQDSEKIDARRIVIQKLKNEKLVNWNEDYKISASKVCSSYDVTGIFLRQNLAPKEIIIENYGPSIKTCFEVCKPFIIKMRENIGNNYWDDFEWLYDEVLSYEKKTV